MKQKINPGPLGIIIIIALIITFELYTHVGPFDQDSFNVVDGIIFSASIITMFITFLVAAKFKPTSLFPKKAFIVLGVAIFFFFLGDLTYLLYDVVLDEDPYPSIGDLFYWLFAPLAIYHMFLVLRSFHTKFTPITIILMASIATLITLFYAHITISEYEEINFDFWYGMIFVSSSSTVLSFATVGILKFKYSVTGVVWLFLFLGMLTNSLGDIWYYHLEVLGEYESLHTVDTLWISTWVLIFYAMYRYKTTL